LLERLGVASFPSTRIALLTATLAVAWFSKEHGLPAAARK
jgi:hypothetical protein